MPTPEPVAPSFPLGRDEFARALACGLGRARLHIERCGIDGVEDLLLDACLHLRAYDAQCEDDRAPWMDDLVALAGIEQRVLPALVEALGHVPDPDSWDTLYRCSLAARLAARGYAAAREALYTTLRLSPDPVEPYAVRAICTLDGPRGLIFIADAIGRALSKDPTRDVDDGLLHIYDSVHERGVARTILEEAAGAHADIRSYLDRVAQHPPHERRTITSLAEALREIEHPQSGISRYPLAHWGHDADEKDLQAVAQYLSDATDPGIVRNCIKCFSRRAYPPVQPRLIELTEHSESRIRLTAVRALALYAAAETRNLALRRIGAGQVADGEVGLLVQNFQVGDEALLIQTITPLTDPDALHTAAMDALRVLEANCPPASGSIALLIYERNPCSLCRTDAVRLLIEQNQAPEWLLEEGRWDADRDTRSLCSGTPPTAAD